MSFYLQPSNYLQITFMKVAPPIYLQTFTRLYIGVKVEGWRFVSPK